jgi:hypothetical protein
MYKCFVSIVVLHITLQDIVAADQAYMQHLQDDTYLASDECALSEDLIGAYKRSDESLLSTVLMKPHWQYLDTPIGRLVRTLSLYRHATQPAKPMLGSKEPSSHVPQRTVLKNNNNNNTTANSDHHQHHHSPCPPPCANPRQDIHVDDKDMDLAAASHGTDALDFDALEFASSSPVDENEAQAPANHDSALAASDPHPDLEDHAFDLT